MLLDMRVRMCRCRDAYTCDLGIEPFVGVRELDHAVKQAPVSAVDGDPAPTTTGHGTNSSEAGYSIEVLRVDGRRGCLNNIGSEKFRNAVLLQIGALLM